jgi:hypothetical protein
MNHFLDNMLNLGSAGGFSTQTGERGLKFWAKIFAVTAQKRSDEVFSGQVVSRIHESELLGAITGSGDRRESTAVLGSDEVEVHFSDNFSVCVVLICNRALPVFRSIFNLAPADPALIKRYDLPRMPPSILERLPPE